MYHVMSRGVAPGDVFYADEDYHKLLEYLEKTSEKFQLEIFAFVLMGNHLKTQRRLKKEIDQILYSIFKVCLYSYSVSCGFSFSILNHS